MRKSFVDYPTVHEALLYKRMPEKKVECGLCERRCLIENGKKGHCKTRKNIDGKLYTLVYGDISAIESRPIEVKPFFHYWPGSTALTLSTWSCNFDCPWCQNFHLSKSEPNPAAARFHSFDSIVDISMRRNDEGVCISFQEPTLLSDWATSLFKAARRKGLYSCFVSNGYMTSEALQLLKNSGMDGLKIDIKGDSETYRKYCCDVELEKVWKNAREAKKSGIHVEVVNLLINGVSDTESCVEETVEHHLRDVGPDTPLHFVRYYPAYKFDRPPTKIRMLERAYQMAKKSGVHYPYIGNVPGHKYESTYCRNCGEKLVQRSAYSIRKYNVTQNKKCPKCNTRIPIRGEYIKKPRAFFVA